MSEHDEIQNRFREAMASPKIAQLPYELARNAIEHLLNQEFSGERALAEGSLTVTRNDHNAFVISSTSKKPLSEASFGALKGYLDAVWYGLRCLSRKWNPSCSSKHCAYSYDGNVARYRPPK